MTRHVSSTFGRNLAGLIESAEKIKSDTFGPASNPYLRDWFKLSPALLEFMKTSELKPGDEVLWEESSHVVVVTFLSDRVSLIGVG